MKALERPPKSVAKALERALRTAGTLFVAAAAALAQSAPAKSASVQPAPDLTRQPTLFIVGYAHLDTEWRWEYPQVIQEYLPKTMRNNFALFEKYPHYIFNFTGSNRYMMMKEYYPDDYARLKHYVELGRWFPAGSSVEENDVNTPSPESIIRQVLYGNTFFRHEFGKASEEFMLPDCFGFPASLPSILAHAGVKGFSTQKLTWQSATKVGGPDSSEHTPEGIPFNVGLWTGPDGKSVIAALDPGDYTGQVYSDLSKDNVPPTSVGGDRSYVWDWPDRVNRNGKVSGIYTDYHYVGTGDIGGSPNEDTVKLMEAIETKGVAGIPAPPRRGRSGPQPPPPASPPRRVGDGPLQVVWSDADAMFRDIKPSQMARLPRYQGDLELIHHSAGSITSQTYHKRWNRHNEILANAAEETSVAAAWLGGRTYPLDRLNHAWRLVMGGQFHDIMAGTSTPQSYIYSWNDDVLAMNQFASVITSATDAVASALDTRGGGTPIVVFNCLNTARQDVVEADVSFPDGAPAAVRVTGPDGKEVPAQLDGVANGVAKVLFLADVPPVGFAVYDVQPTASGPAASSPLHVTEYSLENARYRVRIDANGDVSSVFDKTLGRELLSGPIRLAILTDNPEEWPAWNMDFEDEQRTPRTYVGGPVTIRVAENGPVRVALEITREAEHSKFVGTVRLSAGDAGNRVEFTDSIDWMAKAANLKVVFPLSAANEKATYNWGIGTIQRPNENPDQFEVATHRWVDLTDRGGAYGVTLLTNDKLGSDKPADNTLRLTLIRTPGTRGGYPDQATQDWGHHEILFGFAAHAGDWRQGQTDWQAYRLDEPLMVFESSKHAGFLGKTFSLLKVSNSRIRLMALKKAEESDEVIVRLVETSGKAEPDVHISFAAPVVAAREVNGQEQPVGQATVNNGELVTSFSAYQPRSFAVKLAPPGSRVAGPVSQPVALAYDASVSTRDGKPGEGCFDCDPNNQTAKQGKALPAEMLPAEISYAGIHFQLSPGGTGKPNAVTARGQTIHLPAGAFNRLYILAAAYDGDQKATFQVGGKPIDLTIEDWGGYIGQWDYRTWETRQVEVPEPPEPAAGDQSAQAQRARRMRAMIKERGPIYRTEPVCTGLNPGYIKRAPVAWFASHDHAADGSNEPYSYAYLFAGEVDLPAGASTLTLPNNDRIRILAVTVANESGEVHAAHPLYDTLARDPKAVTALQENFPEQ